MNTPDTYLHTGDVIAYAGQICRVVKVSESWATVAISRPARTFTTLWGKTVTLQPAPKLEHISPNSCVPILNRNTP
jgi:hypothetical protein